jgi:quercetin dioxygenase-like cupin family protein
MTKQRIGVLVACLLLVAVVVAQTPPARQTTAEKKSGGAKSSVLVMPGSEQWTDIPAAALVGTPSVEMGGTVKIAVLQGDPTAGGSFTMRISCTDGTKIAPHWHPTTENVTVIKGTFLLGMGAKWDDAAMKEMPVGGFASAPAQMRHYARCKGDSVVQVNGIGPFVVNFVGPDDPGPAKKTN